MWLGLAKIGVVTALINTNLVSDPLIHSITVAKSKAIIFGQDFKKGIIKSPIRAFGVYPKTFIAAIKDVSDKLKTLKFYQLNEHNNSDVELLEGCENLRKCLQEQNGDALEDDVAAGKPRDSLIYIYTSGTTGLPKAAVITNVR